MDLHELLRSPGNIKLWRTSSNTQLHFPPDPPRVSRNWPAVTSVRTPLRSFHDNGYGVAHTRNITMGEDLSCVTTQRTFLHEEVRVAKVELMDLVCQELQLDMNVASYTRLSKLRWTLGQQLAVDDGRTYWCTDTQYPAYGYGTRRRRRDVFQLGGTETVDVTLPNGTVTPKTTALACESVCFLQLSGPELKSFDIPSRLTCSEFQFDDQLTFVLGRYLSPHPESWDRDAMHRPVCPGPLRVNHCLWTYAKTRQPRRVLSNRDGSPSAAYLQQRHLFGRTLFQQGETRLNEMHAYFCLAHYSCILEKMHVTREFDESGAQTDTWLQSVTVL